MGLFQRLCIYLMLSILLQNCGVVSSMHDRPEPKPPIENPRSSNSSLTFCKDIQPILSNHCVSCHRTTGTMMGNLALDIYDQPGKPLVERWRGVLSRIENGSMPPTPYEKLSQQQKEIIVRWYSEGRQNCDPVRKNWVGASIKHLDE